MGMAVTRTEIARIINPRAFDGYGSQRSGINQDAALAKADAILALLSNPDRGGQPEPTSAGRSVGTPSGDAALEKVPAAPRTTWLAGYNDGGE